MASISRDIDWFEERVSISTGGVYRTIDGRWRYIPIHPFSDESADLERLGIKSEACTGVDAYWLCEGHVAFVKVISSIRYDFYDEGFYARTESDRIPSFDLMAVTNNLAVSRPLFEEALTKFCEAEFWNAGLKDDAPFQELH